MSWACSCVRKAACGGHRYGGADFVGEVVSRQVLTSDDKLGPYYVLFQVRVIESFRGAEKTGGIVGVRTGFGGGDCGYNFKIGAKYLIDASKNDGILVTGICFLTAPIEDSEVELRSLRRIAAGERQPDLVGVLMRGTETDDGESFAPLLGVPVEAKSTGDGSAQRTVTDSIGSFTFRRLAEGTYKLIPGLPANLSAAFTDAGPLGDDQVPSISIESTDTYGAACFIRIFVEPSGSISGIVQSSGTAPIDGWVNADTVTHDGQPWNTVRNAMVGPDGKFSLRHLKPGRYSVHFTSRAGFVAGKPQTIDLGDGEPRAGVMLPSR